MDAYELDTHDRCDRCHRHMSARAMSYFTEEFICMDCLRGEGMLVAMLRLLQIDVARLAGCGYLPDPTRLTVGAQPPAAAPPGAVATPAAPAHSLGKLDPGQSRH